jgi:hypothetical protein
MNAQGQPGCTSTDGETEMKTTQQSKTVIALLAMAFTTTLSAPARADNTSGVPIPPKPAFATADAAARGHAIAKHADAYDSGWVDQYLQARMTLIDARGQEVVRETRGMTLEGGAGDKALIRFMSPADIRGVAALIHEHPQTADDTWLYLPATRRVRRIAGANRTASFQGTEFTYEDLSSLIVERYDWRFLRETTLTVDGKEEPVYELEARPTYEDTGYSKLVLTVHRDNFRTSQVEFYDKAGERLKTLTASKWSVYHGRFHRPLKLDMRNHQTGKRTVIEASSIFVNLSLYPRRDGSARSNLTNEQFTRRALEEG